MGSIEIDRIMTKITAVNKPGILRTTSISLSTACLVSNSVANVKNF